MLPDMFEVCSELPIRKKDVDAKKKFKALQCER